MKLLLRVFAYFAVLPYLVVAGLVVTGIASWSAVLYVVATGVLLGGLATLPTENGQKKVTNVRRPRGISRVGAGALVLVALIRIVTASRGHTLGVVESGGQSARFVDRLVDESDLALASTRALVASGMLHDDSYELPGAMRAAYVKMRAEEGDVPSPVAATYLGLERPSAFDLVMIEGAPGADPHGAVIFLHGFGGNFDLPCWQIARATGVLTACPSIRSIGDWMSPQGGETLSRTVVFLNARGVTRIVLAGLSNGGIGASELAPTMKGRFVGMILISGADPLARQAEVPTLVIHGKHDTMVEPELGWEYAKRHRSKVVTLDAGHFAMLVRAEEADRAIHDFVTARLAAEPPPPDPDP